MRSSGQAAHHHLRAHAHPVPRVERGDLLLHLLPLRVHERHLAVALLDDAHLGGDLRHLEPVDDAVVAEGGHDQVDEDGQEHDRPAPVADVPVHPAQEAHEDDDDRADPVPDRHHPLEAVPELRHRLVVLGTHEEQHRLGRVHRRHRRHHGLLVGWRGQGHGADRGPRGPVRRHEERGEVLALDAHPAHPVERLAGRRQLGRGEELDAARRSATPGRRLVAAHVPLLRARVGDAGAPDEPPGQRLAVAGHERGHAHEPRLAEGQGLLRRDLPVRPA